MSDIDEAQEDFENEHRYAQAQLQRKRVPVPKGKTLRYEWLYDESGGPTMCDKVWIDRLTGHEVMRYDAADPANTNSYYGARPDEESFIHKGLDIYEVIASESAKPLPRFISYDDGRWD